MNRLHSSLAALWDDLLLVRLRLRRALFRTLAPKGLG
jgi:hypothetical protein